MQSAILGSEHMVESMEESGMRLQNPYCVACSVDGSVLARQGAMVANRGELDIRVHSQGIKKLLKRTVTGEGLALMEVEGRGEIWFAELAKNVFTLTLGGGDGLSVSGKSVLCFDTGLSYEIGRVKGAGMAGGGLFNCSFEGTGSLAITAHGEPFVIPVSPDSPVRVDTDAVIAWSSSLETGIHRSESAKSFLEGGSGETFQLELGGEGFVVVQPSEGPVDAGSGDGGGDGVGDAIGELLGG